MSWEAVGAISEAVGAAGVIITLAYLAVQIRSQSQATRVQNMRDRANQNANVFNLQASPQTMESAVAKTWATGEELTTEEHFAIESYISIFLLSAECEFRLYSEGLLTKSEWVPIRNQIKLVFTSEPPRSWWSNVTSQIFTEAFRVEIDSIVEEAKSQPNPYERLSTTAPNKSLEADT